MNPITRHSFVNVPCLSLRTRDKIIELINHISGSNGDASMRENIHTVIETYYKPCEFSDDAIKMCDNAFTIVDDTQQQKLFEVFMLLYNNVGGSVYEIVRDYVD
jgi:hypothetical protein